MLRQRAAPHRHGSELRRAVAVAAAAARELRFACLCLSVPSALACTFRPFTKAYALQPSYSIGRQQA